MALKDSSVVAFHFCTMRDARKMRSSFMRRATRSTRKTRRLELPPPLWPARVPPVAASALGPAEELSPATISNGKMESRSMANHPLK